ncbi:MAG TPA: PA0069 family radical SAM protein [Dongiaceae bacterium]|nr:PA0069 family radical SAM protein [Dongiaceae bacterium]
MPIDGGGSASPGTALPDLALKGRGAVSNRPGRYEPGNRPLENDGWGHDPGEDDDLPPLRTTVTIDATRSSIAWNESPDLGFDRSLNPYRGCEHGCIYCFARPTHAYLGLSPGLDFETKLLAKPEAPRLLAEELSRPSYKPAPIGLGTNTDPYQPLEREMRITRGVLEVLAAFNHPVTIVTKSALVTRDIDILAEMARKSLAHVSISVTTLDKHLARKMEPRAPTLPRRLEAMRRLAEAGIPVGVMAAPMIPALNDMELEAILSAAAKAGASGAGFVLLRLPLEIKDLFAEWLEAHVPGKARHVQSLIAGARRGSHYVDEFGERMRGHGPYAELLAKRFRLAIKRYGLERRGWDLRTDLFQVPPKKGDQLCLL